MDYISEKMGSWQINGDDKSGQVRFGLFFPDEDHGLRHQIKTIQVCGSFQKTIGLPTDWDTASAPFLEKTVHPEGEVWQFTTSRDLPADFYEYKYYVTFNDSEESERWVSDPCARYGGRENMNAAVVVGGSQPADNSIAPVAGGRKPLRDLVVYEMMIDDFTAEYRGVRSPLDAVRDKLPYLVDLGCNAILFMPWTAWNDDKFSWGYTPSLYYSVAYRYANDLNAPVEKLSWLKKLIHECHQLGIHVIMDGVFNHVYTGFPYKMFYRTYDGDCPYTGKFYGEFDGLQDLDFNKNCTQDLILDVCRYWIDIFKIDGIRFDNTVNFYHKGDNRGLPVLMEKIENKQVNADEVNFSLTLEHLKKDAVDVTRSTRATSYWDNALHEQCFNSLLNGSIQPDLLNSLNNNRYLRGTGKVPTTYISNHDHSHVAWQAGAAHNSGALEWYRTQPYAIALMTLPGVPLIRNGQEFAEEYWIPEDDAGSNRRVQARPLHWSYSRDRFGRALRRVYSRLTDLRHHYPVLRADGFYPDFWEPWQTRFNPEGVGVDTEKQLVVYRRYHVDNHGSLMHAVIVLNFSASGHGLTLTFPEDGQWVDLLAEPRHPVHVNDRHIYLDVPAHWGCIFYK
ncbi:MAG: alpha-amylase [Desulfobacteraceae bacterium]|nr:alpha-amylase [Desulfobacteraceae bacterium]